MATYVLKFKLDKLSLWTATPPLLFKGRGG